MMIPNEPSQILVVDDNPQNLQVIGNILKAHGYRIAMAQNGRQAIEYVEKKNPDLILMDIMMPGMDGLETCQAIKANEKGVDIPIIFITALTESGNKLKAFEVGGVDYITKPFMKEEVLARVKVHIGLKKAMERLQQMVVTDEMTGVFNRRYAYEVLSREMSVAKRNNTLFTLCFVDIDNLKVINDTYGHEKGDQLINEVVKGFTGAIRTSDYIFRMGGDEFLLLFPGTDIEDATILVQRLYDKINRKEICGMPIDFSVGFAKFGSNDDINSEELIKTADDAMYEQKQQKKKKQKNGTD